MSLSDERILFLLQAYSRATATEEEEQELYAWVSAEDREELLKTHLESLLQEEASPETYPGVDWERLFVYALQADHQGRVRRLPWWRAVAAAAVLLIIGSSIYFWKAGHRQVSPAAPVKAVMPVADVAAPHSILATLTLEGGKRIILDSAASGVLASQGNVKVMKTADGQVTYSAAGASHEVMYNTLTNPRGSKVVSVALSDGTRVWLNAQSSLTYPTAFAGKERKVSITGEAYFEVTHDASRPFEVSQGHTVITVLGTSFNANTYMDETYLTITLLEGSVAVGEGVSPGQVLKPGQQALVNEKGTVRLNRNVDVEAVMAWKNGQFVLQGTDLAALMRQLGRWYDVSIDYGHSVPARKFGGAISRDLSLNAVLEALRENGVNCVLKDNASAGGGKVLVLQ